MIKDRACIDIDAEIEKIKDIENKSNKQVINFLLNKGFEQFKNIRKNLNENLNNETYESTTKTAEQSGDFIHIINILLSLQGLNFELCGRWIWIDGNTKEHKDTLKELGCKWASKKKMWSWHFAEDGVIAFKKKTWEMSKIRETFGFETFIKNERLAIS